MEVCVAGERSGELDARADFDHSASTAWDASTADQHRDGLSEYLAEAASSTPIQTAAARALQLMRIGPGDRVLDIGCGTGVSLAGLATQWRRAERSRVLTMEPGCWKRQNGM
jgi:protein-L-isoaspartate O-methyltransferase